MSTNLNEPSVPNNVPLQIPTTVDYTSRDFTGLAASMLLYAAQIFPNWNPTSEGDMGVMLLELFAYVGDILSYYTDRVAQEAYISTATQRLSLLNIAALLGYTPNNGAPSQGTVELTTNNPGPSILVPQYTQLQANFNTSTDAPILFYTTDIVDTVPGNGGTLVVPVTQGQIFTKVPIGTSNGLPGQVLIIPNTGVQDGTVHVFVQTLTGVNQWTEVTTFIDSDGEDMVFTVFTDANNNTNVVFGDNINGQVPGLGLQIYASYITIVGTQGNIGAGSVNSLVTNIPGLAVAFNSQNVAQSSAMTGGADPESNDSIRANAPATFQTQSRAISLDDYQALALTVPGVSLANATANHSTSVSLYILGPNGSSPSASLSNTVLDFFNGPPQKYSAGTTLTLPQPTLVALDIGQPSNPCTLQISDSFNQQNVINGVVNALITLLSPPNVSFGQLFQVSSVYATIMALPGVQYVIIPVITREDTVQTGTTPIQFRQNEVPVPNTTSGTGLNNTGFYFNVFGGQ